MGLFKTKKRENPTQELARLKRETKELQRLEQMQMRLQKARRNKIVEQAKLRELQIKNDQLLKSSKPKSAFRLGLEAEKKFIKKQLGKSVGFITDSYKEGKKVQKKKQSITGL